MADLVAAASVEGWNENAGVEEERAGLEFVPPNVKLLDVTVGENGVVKLGFVGDEAPKIPPVFGPSGEVCIASAGLASCLVVAGVPKMLGVEPLCEKALLAGDWPKIGADGAVVEENAGLAAGAGLAPKSPPPPAPNTPGLGAG